MREKNIILELEAIQNELTLTLTGEYMDHSVICQIAKVRQKIYSLKNQIKEDSIETEQEHVRLMEKEYFDYLAPWERLEIRKLNQAGNTEAALAIIKRAIDQVTKGAAIEAEKQEINGRGCPYQCLEDCWCDSRSNPTPECFAPDYKTCYFFQNPIGWRTKEKALTE